MTPPPSKKEKWSIALPENWPTCELCETRIRPDRKKYEHHFCYDPEVTATLCYKCHVWLHGTGPVYHHPFQDAFESKEDKKAFAPIVFAYRLIELFERKISGNMKIIIAIPQVVQAGYPATMTINPKQGKRRDN